MKASLKGDTRMKASRAAAKQRNVKQHQLRKNYFKSARTTKQPAEPRRTK